MSHHPLRLLRARRGRMLMLLFCAWMAGSAAVAASATDALDQLMTRLRQRQHGHVSFTELHVSSVLDRPLASSGELFYDAPDRLEKRTTTPRPERMVLENGQLSFERRHKAYHVALADYPQAVPYIEAIRATMSGDRPALERVFRIAFNNSGDQWTLRLTPLDAHVAAEVAAVRIDGLSDAIKTVTVQLVNGDRSITTLGAAMDP
jgi:Outer membrane lipoprotein carrier protein LolA-like